MVSSPDFLSSLYFVLADAAAAPAGGAQGQQQGGLFGGNSMLPMMLVMFALMYFMLIRPQRRQQKEHMARIAALKSGDEVITNGGIHGLITNVAERTVTLKIADNVKIKIEKSAIAIIPAKPAEPAEKAEAAPEAETKS